MTRVSRCNPARDRDLLTLRVAAQYHLGRVASKRSSMDEFYRIKRLPPYVFAIVNDLKTKARARGEDVIDLGMGNPDLGTPKHIVAKLVEAAQKPKNHRSSASRGITRLRKAMEKWYRDRYAVELDHDSEVIATIGAKEGIAHLALAVLQPGDGVLVPNPTYPIHSYSVVIADGDLRSVPLTPDGDFFARLQETARLAWPKAKMVQALARIKSYLDYGAFQPIQIASIVALEGDQKCVEQIVEVHRKRRDVLVDGLNKLGWSVAKPKGTMFVWAPIPEPWKSLGSLEFSKLLIQEAK